MVSYINYQGGLRSCPFSNWRAKSSCDPKGSCCLCEQLTSRGSTIQERASAPVETGAEARGIEAPHRGGGVDMEVSSARQKWICVHLERHLTVHSGSPSRIQLLLDWTRWCRCGLGFICMHFPRSLCSWESWREFAGTGFYYFHCPAVAGQSIVLRYNIPSGRASSGAPRQQGPSVPSRGLEISPPTRTVETVGLASEGAQLIDSGLSTEVVETILHSRAPSTRKLYALKWRIFTSWCSDHQVDTVNCAVGTVLEFLQERFTARLAPFTLKVYAVAISAYHIRLGGISLGKTPWYLVSSVVLEALSSSFQNADQERHNLLCPVRALEAYIHRAALWRKNKQLFVCLDLLTRGLLHLSKGWASGWSRPSYLLMSRPVNLLLWLSGPTRPGVWRPPRPWCQELLSKRFCDAAGWSSPHTFVRFYSLDLDSTPGSQVLPS